MSMVRSLLGRGAAVLAPRVATTTVVQGKRWMSTQATLLENKIAPKIGDLTFRKSWLEAKTLINDWLAKNPHPSKITEEMLTSVFGHPNPTNAAKAHIHCWDIMLDLLAKSRNGIYHENYATRLWHRYEAMLNQAMKHTSDPSRSFEALLLLDPHNIQSEDYYQLALTPEPVTAVREALMFKDLGTKETRAAWSRMFDRAEKNHPNVDGISVPDNTASLASIAAPGKP